MMENNAIKEIVKETCSGCYGSDAEPFRCKKCGYKTAIDALEKQIPKKPIEGNFFPQCPICGETLRINQSFCDGCGQKLDWEGR